MEQETRPPLSLLDALATIPDFRISRRRRHSLHELLAITVLSLICGGTSYYDHALFGREKLEWLRTFLRLENGIPSHDTFRRVLSAMDPKRFNVAFAMWMASVGRCAGDIVSVDGKCLRRAFGKDGRIPCIVSAYARGSRVVVGQSRTSEKSNEITAIPELLKALHLKGCIVTIDAAGCQKNTVKEIAGKGADYVIALKDNQPTMHGEMRMFFEDSLRAGGGPFASHTEVSSGHGRVETRTCWQTADIGWFEDRKEWAGLRSVCFVRSDVCRKSTGATSSETRCFISSLPVNPKKALDAVRSHWGVESMHWILDMEFDEDHSRARAGHAAENLAALRHLALNAMRRDKDGGGGIHRRRKEVTWNERKLFRLITRA